MTSAPPPAPQPAPLTATPWLSEHAGWLPTSGTALDVACGTGRHGLWLASRGLDVTAVDIDERRVAALSDEAARLGLPVHAAVRDLEGEAPDLGEARYDVIVVVHYLHRPLFPALREALRPGGVLVYETFTTAQAAVGRPSNPAFLLEPGELVQLVQPLDVVESREGWFDGRYAAGVIARRR